MKKDVVTYKNESDYCLRSDTQIWAPSLNTKQFQKIIYFM